MHWLPPLDRSGQVIPVPTRYPDSWRKLAAQLLASLLAFPAILLIVLIMKAVFITHDPQVLLWTARRGAPIIAVLSVFFSFYTVALPRLMWLRTRRKYGRQLEAHIEQMTVSELNQQIEACDIELRNTPSAWRRARLIAWRRWLEAKRVARAVEIAPR